MTTRILQAIEFATTYWGQNHGRPVPPENYIKTIRFVCLRKLDSTRTVPYSCVRSQSQKIWKDYSASCPITALTKPPSSAYDALHMPQVAALPGERRRGKK